MNEKENVNTEPINVVRYGMGKELQLYKDSLVVVAREEGKETSFPLHEIKRLILMPGDPNPAKLILMADLYDDSSLVLVNGMTNARDFRDMIPHLQQLQPDLELDPPDMAEQLRQALNTRRAWTLTCYGTIILILLILYALYLIVAFVGAHR